MFNFVMILAFFEAHCYIMNEEKVKLFLAKDLSERQERQTHSILHNAPTNVMVISDNKLKFNNKHAEKLIKELQSDLGIPQASDETTEVKIQKVLLAKIFKPVIER